MPADYRNSAVVTRQSYPVKLRSSRARATTCSTIIDRQASPGEAGIAAVVASDLRFAYFGTAAFAVRLLRLDHKLADGIPLNPRRMANVLNTKPELLREFCGHLVKQPRDRGAVRRWEAGRNSDLLSVAVLCRFRLKRCRGFSGTGSKKSLHGGGLGKPFSDCPPRRAGLRAGEI
jgi:hypothetical protein